MEVKSVSLGAQAALVKFLIKLNLIAPADGPAALDQTTLCPVAFYAQSRVLVEEDAITIIAQALEIEQVSLGEAETERVQTLLESDPIKKVTIERWAAMRSVPIGAENGQITIVMANPLDYDSRNTLEFEFGCPVNVLIGKESEIVAALRPSQDGRDYSSVDEILGNTDLGALGSVERDGDPSMSDSDITNTDIEAAPIVKLVNKILYDAVHQGASDVHITPERDRVQIKIRVDGIMRPLFAIPTSVQNHVISRLKLLGGMDISERRKPQDGRLRIKSGLGIKDLRLSTVPSAHGENLVARILSSEVKNLSFASLGMPQPLIDQMERALTGSSKVVLVSGPTGSGKTSSLYAALLHLRDGKSNIITVEDPIEYRITGVTQIQVNSKVGMTFAEGLRSILRQDPDTIMVGEIRDPETASIAMQTAQTGHMVLSTIHTNSAPAAITRLQDLGIEPYLVASSIGAVVAQRLLRKLCPECCRELSQKDKDRCKAVGLDPDPLREAVGCKACHGTGYTGRTGIYSFLEITDDVRNAIRDELSEDEIARRARPAGFQSLAEDALILLYNGVTTIEEFERVLGPLDLAAHALKSAAGEADLQTLRREEENKTPTVLVVEDDENMRLILTTILEKQSYEVEQAANGHEGLERLKESKPNLILCDYMMPGMDGVQFLDAIRSNAETADIPFLMLTAIGDEQTEVSTLKHGADDFVAKTSSSHVVLARVQRLLERGRG